MPGNAVHLLNLVSNYQQMEVGRGKVNRISMAKL